MQCETVQIVSEKSDDNPLGFIVINAEDFNADEHTLFQAEGEAAPDDGDTSAPRGRKPRAGKE